MTPPVDKETGDKIMKKCKSHNGFGCLGNILATLFKACHCEGDQDGGQESGSLVLGYGHHEVTVTTSFTPSNVSLSLGKRCEATTVCQGDVTMLGYVIQPTGFVLYADIKTNTCEVLWTVEN